MPMEKAGLVTMSLSISLLSPMKTKLGREERERRGSREEASKAATNFTFLSQHALHEAKAGMNYSTALMRLSGPPAHLESEVVA